MKCKFFCYKIPTELETDIATYSYGHIFFRGGGFFEKMDHFSDISWFRTVFAENFFMQLQLFEISSKTIKSSKISKFLCHFSFGPKYLSTKMSLLFSRRCHLFLVEVNCHAESKNMQTYLFEMYPNHYLFPKNGVVLWTLCLGTFSGKCHFLATFRWGGFPPKYWANGPFFRYF